MPIKDPDKRREYQRMYQKKHYESKRWYYKEKAKEYQELLRNVVREAKSVPCTDCKVQYPYYVMQLDHVRGEKLMDPANLWRTGSMRKTKEELDKCEPVCANCHAERTFKRSGVVQR